MLCDKHHVALATVTGDVDLATSQGRLLARTWGAFAAHESEIKSERMTRANLERARQGIMRTPRQLYGYTARATAIKPGEAKVICEAAGRLLRGDSLRGICIDFNARRIPSPRKALWQAPALHDILGNPRLAGWSTYHGEVVGKGAWKAILTRRQSERIRSLLSDPERVLGDGTRHCYLLTGLARCVERPRTHAHGIVRSYRCARQAGRKGCGRLSITMDDLDATFMDRLYERLDSTALPAALQRGRLRRFAEAMAMGADAVRVGTRFVTSPESGAHSDYVEMLLQAGDGDTELTEWFNEGWPDAPESRAPLRTRGCARVGLARDRTALSRGRAHGERHGMYAGLGVGAVTSSQPAAAVVVDLVSLL